MSKMRIDYKKLYQLKRYKKVIEIVKQNQNNTTTMKGLWKKYVFPVYPMGYKTFLRILEEGNIDKQIAEIERKIKNKE
jgi:hypothetical protein